MSKDSWQVDIADIDVGGDYHRIILGGVPLPTDLSAFEMRRLINTRFDSLRHLMISAPMGHEDMCANLIFSSVTKDAPFGQVIMECMGYPYFSGSNTAATLFALMEARLLPKQEGVNQITHEVPAGLIHATATVQNGIVEEMVVEGVKTSIPLHAELIRQPDILSGDYSIKWLEEWLAGRDNS